MLGCIDPTRVVGWLEAVRWLDGLGIGASGLGVSTPHLGVGPCGALPLERHPHGALPLERRRRGALPLERHLRRPWRRHEDRGRPRRQLELGSDRGAAGELALDAIALGTRDGSRMLGLVEPAAKPLMLSLKLVDQLRSSVEIGTERVGLAPFAELERQLLLELLAPHALGVGALLGGADRPTVLLQPRAEPDRIGPSLIEPVLELPDPCFQHPARRALLGLAPVPTRSAAVRRRRPPAATLCRSAQPRATRVPRSSSARFPAPCH